MTVALPAAFVALIAAGRAHWLVAVALILIAIVEAYADGRDRRRGSRP